MAQQTINTPRDTTFNTTENTPRNLADVLADELSGIASEIANIGSSDYDDLTNKPQVNGVTLSGNKSSDDLSLAMQEDLTSIKATGTTNATGATITSGTFFYLNGTLCKAKSDIATGATFTLNTNYEVVTAGGLNSLNSAISYIDVPISGVTDNDGTFNLSHFIPVGYYPTQLIKNGYVSIFFNGTSSDNIVWFVLLVNYTNMTPMANTAINCKVRCLKYNQ